MKWIKSDKSDKNIEIYFYNGFYSPERIDIDNLVITHNYLGDITEEVLEEYKRVMEEYDVEDMIVEQPLSYYDLYINPSYETFRDVNKFRFGLDEDEYLEDWINK